MGILAIISMLALSARVGLQESAAQNAGDTRVVTSSDQARTRISPTLLRTMETAPNQQVMVHAYVTTDADLSSYMPDAIRRAWASPNGLTIVSGTVRAQNLLKLASVDGVVMIDPMRGGYQPAYAPFAADQPDIEPSAELSQKMTQAIQSREGATTMALDQGDVAPNDWADVGQTHNSRAAWEKGFTGDGVKVMANDSGIDFAHPDLYGTWATVDNPDSPYAGWPMQFDAYSMFLYARDVLLGESNIASGTGYYADTSTVITADDPTYQPLDADEARSYTLTGTSQSGEYHIGTHPDNSLRSWYFVATGQEPPEDPEEDPGERPAILVVDEQQAGVYDTVYMDLDFDNDFSDEAPVTKEHPVAGRDWWGAYDPEIEDFAPEPDGLFDISGGLVYWITDGVNPIPAADWWYGIGAAGNGAQDEGEPGAGDMVLFTVNDFAASPGGDHGQLVASAVAAQGVISGDSAGAVLNDDPISGVVPPYKPDDVGMVVAAGKDVDLVSAGDFYSFGGLDAHVFAAVGYDGVPGTGDDIQVINDSWGSSAIQNDGWDEVSRAIDQLTRPVNPTLLVTVAVGNGAPGFGTVSSPANPNGLMVGASTQHGSTGWDSATTAEQITYGDIASFSGRGPGARGDAGVDVVASGSRAAGDIPLNSAMSGAHAWTTWGGTSRSAPVAAGNAALVYQAYRATYGAWPNFDMAKMLMMSGATDLHYDPFLQGAGMVNAADSVDMASGVDGAYVWPNAWRVGDFDGVEYPGFANVIRPGGTDEQVFQINNPSGEMLPVTVSDQWLQKTGEWEIDWTSSSIDQEPITVDPEDPSATELDDWNTPHYLWNVSDKIPEGTDLVVLRIDYGQEYFDPEESYQWEQTNSWYLLGYDWTDVDGDGQLWTDADGDGVVDDGEIDKGEYVRTEYANNRANNLQVTVQQPQNRMHDGLFIGLQHSQARTDVPQTPMIVGMDFYDRVDMPWLEVQTTEQLVGAQSSGYVTVKANVPGDAETGLYEAAVKVAYGDDDAIVPVVINVIAPETNLTAGATEDDAEPSLSFYNPDQVYGAQSWRWREEAGDWRFYYSNLLDDVGPLGNRMPDGSYYYLADVSWENLPSDVGVTILSPAPDDFTSGEAAETDYYGPYTLDVAATGNPSYVGEGIYRVNTSSGSSREVIAAPYQPGLNAILLHNTNFDGQAPVEPVSIRTGMLAVSQSPMTLSGPSGVSQSAPLTVLSSIPLSGLSVEGFGLSKPVVEEGVAIQQDNPNDPSTASVTRELTLENAGLLQIDAVGAETDDIDLYVLRDINEDGEFDFESEQVASSTTPGAEEHVSIQLPEDGDYLVAVHGWSVPSETGSAFDLSILAVQGDDVQASGAPEGAVPAFQNVDLQVDFNTEGLEPGQYTGLVTLGPPEGPSAVLVFVDYTVH